MEQNQQVAGGKSIVRRSEKEIQRLLNEREQSGLMVKEYFELYEIIEQTFYGWAKRYRSKGAKDVKDMAAQPGSFATIKVVLTLEQDKPRLFAKFGCIKLYKEGLRNIFKNTCIMSKLSPIRYTVNYYLHRKEVKMSPSFDGLAALIRTALDEDIISDVFIFLNRSRTVIKFFAGSHDTAQNAAII